MTSINIGETLYLPVDVDNGAFRGECLISFDTLEGPVSGFISSDQVLVRDNGKVVEAKVVGVEPDRILIRLHGSFFTTTGLAHISHQGTFERAA